MIKFLAQIRGASLIFGITAPPPGKGDLALVILWLGIIAVVIVFTVLLFQILSNFHVR
jgi:hypothetical protein